MHIRGMVLPASLLFFGTTTIGEAQGLLLGRTTPVSKRVLIYCWIQETYLGGAQYGGWRIGGWLPVLMSW